MKLVAGFLAIIAPFLIAGAVSISAAQPREDSVVLDKDGCSVELSWVDGLETTSKITFSVDGVVKNTFTIDDIVGDQSDVLLNYTGVEGQSLRARLYVGTEIASEATATITKCPTATPTSTATPTNTATPVATSTATPVPPIPTPIVIVQTVEVPVVRTVIQPPSTGDAGLK